MRAPGLTTAFLCALTVLVAMAGCKSKRPKPSPAPPVAVISMHAQPDVNPGPDGRPSPIVLRLYQLKADAAFGNSDYFPLFDDEKKVLGGDLVSREEKELFPGQTDRGLQGRRARGRPRGTLGGGSRGTGPLGETRCACQFCFLGSAAAPPPAAGAGPGDSRRHSRSHESRPAVTFPGALRHRLPRPCRCQRVHEQRRCGNLQA